MTSNEKLSPYRAAMSVNHRILSLSTEIAFRLGKLSCLGTVNRDAKFVASEVKYTLLQEGIALSPSQTRALNKGEKIIGQEEANALFFLYSHLNRFDPYDESIMKEYEKAMYPDGAPSRKTSQIDGFPFLLPPVSKLSSLNANLFSYASKNKGGMSEVTLACLYYYEILALAPYGAENGLLARFLFKAMLGKAGRSMEALQIEKTLYFALDKITASFEEAAKKQDSAPFVETLLSLILSSVESLLKEASSLEDASSPLVERMLGKMADGRYYSAKELCLLLGLKSRLGLAKNYLRPALSSGKIAMSNPLCPTARNQRYRKKESI